MNATRAAALAFALATLALAGCLPKPKPATKKPVAASMSKADAAKAEELYIEGVYAYAEGGTAKAMAAWKKCLALNPKHAAAKKAMAEAQAKLDAVKKLPK